MRDDLKAIDELIRIVRKRFEEGEPMNKITSRMLEEIRIRVDILKHRHLYPWSDGTARRQDPTYGRIERDIQWFVNDFGLPRSLAQRVAMENTIQQQRDRRTGVRR